PTKKRVYAGVGLAGALALLLNFPAAPAGASEKVSGTPRVAGIQLEFPSEGEVLSGLNKLTQTFPEAELLVLSEYTLDGPVPERVKTWCRRHQKYLVIGGKDPVGAPEHGVCGRAGRRDCFSTGQKCSDPIFQGRPGGHRAKVVEISVGRDRDLYLLRSQLRPRDRQAGAGGSAGVDRADDGRC